MLRSRKSRREEPLDTHLPDPAVGREDGIDPEHQALLADSVGPALLAMLDPDVVLRGDDAVVRMGASSLVRGAPAVAETFSRRARAAKLALVDGAPGVVWAHGGTPRVVFTFTVTDGKIVAIDMLADLERLGRLDLAIPDD